MTLARFCTTAIAVLIALAATAPGSSAQEFPPVREVRAHRANYSARASRTIRRIVLHTSEGSEASCISWFRNPSARVSAHYLVSHAGRITRFVPDMSVAYHARKYNADSIGIENEGRASRNGWTTAQYRSLAALVRGLCDRYGIPKDRRFIIGHNEVPGSGKADPGRYFDWALFMSLVRGGAPSTSSSSAPPSAGLATVIHGGSAPSSSVPALIEVTADRLNVRAAPGGSILGQVRRGARFAIVERRSGWLRIRWNGRQAWVHADYTRPFAGQ